MTGNPPLLKEQSFLVVTQCLFHASTTSNHAQLRPEERHYTPILRCLGDVTSWNIRQKLKLKLQQQYVSEWKEDIWSSSKLNFYGEIKKVHI